MGNSRFIGMKVHRIVLWALTIVLSLISACSGAGNASESADKPNIILFLVDDLGWQDVSVPFHKSRTGFNDRYHTPHLEQLAESGVRFTNAYSASPVCTPSRVALITGVHPARSGVTNWTLRPDRQEQETAPNSYPLVSPQWNHLGLDTSLVTLPARLKTKGYVTIHAGKAHFGALGTPAADPLSLGFDTNIAGHAAGAPGSFLAEKDYGNQTEGSVWGVPGLEKYHGSETFLTEAITNETLIHVQSAIEKGEPFFLHMAPYAVHVPLAPYEPYYSQFLDEGLDETEARYASMVGAVDDALGRIMALIENDNDTRETIVLFTSDNGGLSYGRRGETPAGTGAHTHNAPLKSGKGSAYEAGSRVPLIISWLQNTAGSGLKDTFEKVGGSISPLPVTGTDLYATVLDLAGINSKWEDGRSVRRMLADEATWTDRPLFWHYPHKWGPEGPGLDPFTAVRRGNWKAIWFYHTKTWELYNLDDDLGETNNLVEANREELARLSNELVDWMIETGAQTPKNRNSGISVAFPTRVRVR